MSTDQREARKARIAAAKAAVSQRKTETGDPFDREYIAHRQAEIAAIDARIRAQVAEIVQLAASTR